MPLYYPPAGASAPVVVRPSQVTSNQNDYAPGSFGTWFISTDASRDFTGIAASGAVDGQDILWVNIGTQDQVLKHEDSGSAAANRLICAGAGDLTVMPGETARIVRDATAGRWRVRLL